MTAESALPPFRSDRYLRMTMGCCGSGEAMKVTGMRALEASRAAMSDAGLGMGHGAGPGEGWIQPNYANSIGYGLRKCPDGNLEWNLKVACDDLVRWRSFTQSSGNDEDDGETIDLHEPVDDEKLHPRIRRVLEGLGLDVTGVRTSGWGGHWDKDVSFIATTRHPEWLEAYDPGNAPQKADGPVLTGYAMRPDRRGEVPVRGALPGYGIGGDPHLTRESVDVLAKATAASFGLAYALDAAGHLVASRDGRRIASYAPVAHVNHWGDTVEVWPVPPMNFIPTSLAEPAAPYLVDGEMRRETPFALLDAQYGDAPWTQPKSGPRP